MITRLNECLDKLGSSVDEVARNLYVMGIKGRPLMCCHCPIANYLKREGFELSGVSPKGISLRGGWDLEPLPKQIEDFILSFDKGNYRALVEYPRPALSEIEHGISG